MWELFKFQKQMIKWEEFPYKNWQQDFWELIYAIQFKEEQSCKKPYDMILNEHFKLFTMRTQVVICPNHVLEKLFYPNKQNSASA